MCLKWNTFYFSPFFCDVCRQRGGWNGPRRIYSFTSSSRAHSDKIPTAASCFRESSFLVVVLDFVGRRCVLEIKDGSQITGSTNNLAVFLQIHNRSKNNTGGYDYVRNIYISSNHGRRHFVSKIQDGSQLTGSRNISKIPTPTSSNVM